MKDSILTMYEDISAFSGARSECKHHLVFGNSLRKLAADDGLYIPLTNAEHNMSPGGNLYQIHGNPVAEKLSKMLGQVAWEKMYYKRLAGVEQDEAREAFRKRYGISYL